MSNILKYGVKNITARKSCLPSIGVVKVDATATFFSKTNALLAHKNVPVINMALEKLKFDNLALRTLPLDSETGNRQRRVEGACFSLVDPTPVDSPETVAVSQSAFELLDVEVTPEVFSNENFAAYFSGNKLLPGSQTAAHCYCGHQFGYFSGQLGDGCAIYLGEVVNQKEERWEMQIKGAGKTPYSRHADGRKVLRSSIREFLCSEAMHYLGVPTTRAGSCVTSNTKVIRDIKYDGNPILEKATVILRIAPTFIRFGSFEIFKPLDAVTGREGPSVGQQDLLDKLLDYTISTFYPQIWREVGNTAERQQMLLEFYEEVLRRTARLVAKWQCVGWCHGVLNTDNMSIMGITIDYGPYGFMDRFDPGFICNGSDDGGRYSFEKQPEICRWNCLKLGEAIQMSLPLEVSKPSIKVFDEEFESAYLTGMREKFGLQKSLDGDKELVSNFLSTMLETGCDFTNGFRSLSLVTLPESAQLEESKHKFLDSIVKECASLTELQKFYKPKIPPGQMAMFKNLLEQQPHLAEVLRGQMAVIDVELKRQEKFQSLKDMTSESKEHADRKLWSDWLDAYVTRLSKESTGSDVTLLNERRLKLMKASNPRIILRNYIAQEAIAKAEEGDYSGVRNLLEVLKTPYTDPEEEFNQEVTSSLPALPDLCRYVSKPSSDNTGLIVT